MKREPMTILEPKFVFQNDPQERVIEINGPPETLTPKVIDGHFVIPKVNLYTLSGRVILNVFKKGLIVGDDVLLGKEVFFVDKVENAQFVPAGYTLADVTISGVFRLDEPVYTYNDALLHYREEAEKVIADEEAKRTKDNPPVPPTYMLILEQQGYGCGSGIGCGTKVSYLSATNMKEARKESRQILSDCGCTGNRPSVLLQSATIIHINKATEIEI